MNQTLICGVFLPPQTERAYQKQPTIFQNKKKILLGELTKEKLPRYTRSVGLGFKTPREKASQIHCDTANQSSPVLTLSLLFFLSGVVTKMKMQRTIVIRRDYLHYIRKYNRFEKRHKNMSVHLSPASQVRDTERDYEKLHKNMCAHLSPAFR
ncbi:40S ribosomal protein S11 [Acipenser oxyrinchus oxyrinchus]|uniref:Small ribosomal subunit protein uS17 n=1 Tax=Acipenser oxyrinchus oxyrinchus TaxID=40147 RepID=A0AAD8CK07_ACIOX|nr:40S ribosomal protein S11 [Acipenser oxyrinchus oxyrinchus]